MHNQGEPKNTYNGNIPSTAFGALQLEAAGLIYGTATLTLHIKDGRLNRFTTTREQSFVSGGEVKFES